MSTFDSIAAAHGAAGALIACLLVSSGVLLLADLAESRTAWGAVFIATGGVWFAAMLFFGFHGRECARRREPEA